MDDVDPALGFAIDAGETMHESCSPGVRSE